MSDEFDELLEELETPSKGAGLSGVGPTGSKRPEADPPAPSEDELTEPGQRRKAVTGDASQEVQEGAARDLEGSTPSPPVPGSVSSPIKTPEEVPPALENINPRHERMKIDREWLARRAAKKGRK